MIHPKANPMIPGDTVALRYRWLFPGPGGGTELPGGTRGTVHALDAGMVRVAFPGLGIRTMSRKVVRRVEA